MGRSRRSKAAKSAALRKRTRKAPPKVISQPFRFLDLPPEIRHVFYDIYFANASVIISAQHSYEEDHEVDMLDELWPHREPL